MIVFMILYLCFYVTNLYLAVRNGLEHTSGPYCMCVTYHRAHSLKGMDMIVFVTILDK